MFKKKKEETDTGKQLKQGKDYTVYNMTSRDMIIAISIGVGIGFVVSWAFFSNAFFALICGVCCAAFAPKLYRNYRRDKVLKLLRIQFKDLLDSLSASYSAGKNTMNAFATSETDMIAIYGENADIVEEVRLINGGLYNNINVEVLLSDFAERSGIDDIQSFADVFEICNRQGGNLKKVVTETRDVIGEKIEIEMEIGTLLAGNKNELNIMIVMPVIIIIMLNGLGSGTANANTLPNIILKIGCIGLFVLAYFIGRKIIKIRI